MKSVRNAVILIAVIGLIGMSMSAPSEAAKAKAKAKVAPVKKVVAPAPVQVVTPAPVAPAPVVSVAPVSQKVTPTLKLTYDTLGRWQMLKQSSSTAALPALVSGFQNAYSNLRMWVNVVDGIDVYADYYISVPPHAGSFYADEGYVSVSKLPAANNAFNLNGVLFDRGITVKAGQFEIDYGNNHLVRANNADSLRNPLIGNYLVDANVVEFGLEAIGNVYGYKWVLGTGNGVNSQNFNEGRGYSLHGKIGHDNGVALSFYRAQNAASASAAAGLFTGPRCGSPYAAGTVTPPTVLTGTNAGGLVLGQGKDVSAYELSFANAAYMPLQVMDIPVDVKGMVGLAIDSAAKVGTTTVTDRWYYYGIEGKVDVAKDMFVAARYSGATPQLLLGAEEPGSAYRAQVGFGYKVMEGALWQTELVYERFNNFTSAQTAGTTFTGNPRFYGVVTQVTLSLPLFDNLAKKS